MADHEANIPLISSRSIASRLYVSHALSAWNSRTFEFGAVLFLATIYSGTLLYASIYALIRSASSTLFSSRIGSYVDKADRLVSIRHGIVSQRVSVVLSCALLWTMLDVDKDGIVQASCFALITVLACVEKLASLGSTVAVERDWVVVICEQPDYGLDRGAMNAGMRRIDLFCKLVAPVFISFVDAGAGTRWATIVVLLLSALSVGVEYFAIARVYHAVPALKKSPNVDIGDTAGGTKPWTVKGALVAAVDSWIAYGLSPAFLASFSLSLLYLTVLSTSVHWQTYLLATKYAPLTVSLFRVLAVVSELAATCVAPILMERIGPIRGGLWSINWQVLMLAPAVAGFYYLGLDIEKEWIAAAVLTAGMIASRLGLWSFDLSVQFIVQDRTAPETRAVFSSCEVALQSFFELLSFAATIAFPRPEQFLYPVLLSFGAVTVAAACFAGYVRRERGHLLHASKCLGCERSKGKGHYERVEQIELADAEERSVRGSA